LDKVLHTLHAFRGQRLASLSVLGTSRRLGIAEILSDDVLEDARFAKIDVLLRNEQPQYAQPPRESLNVEDCSDSSRYWALSSWARSSDALALQATEADRAQ